MAWIWRYLAHSQRTVAAMVSKDFIEIDGVAYRVECNWNANVAFLKEQGADNMEALSKIDQLAPSSLAPLMRACLAEGARLEGQEFPLTSLDLGARRDFTVLVQDFIRIYAAQNTPDIPADESKKVMNPTPQRE